MSRTARRLQHARDRVPSALATLAQLREAIIQGHGDAVLLGLVDELRDDLIAVEDATGVSTPANLFDAS